MKLATPKQLAYLKKLIQQVEPEMVIPKDCTLHQAQRRIDWLLRKKANPTITKKIYMT
jgi:hypothetical protein